MSMPDRVAFTLFGKDIYWYGVIMAVAMIIAVCIAYSEEKRKKLKKDTVIDMCLVVIPSGVVGARLYYVLFELDSYLQDPITILYVWRGGLAIYGAVIGGLLAAFIFAKVRKIRFLTLADIIAPCLVLGQAMGRWGNFFNQEAFGLPVTQEMLAAHPILGYFPISVAIEGTHYFDYAVCTACATAANGGHLHLATFFYESMWCFIVFIVLWLLRKRTKHDGDTFFLYILLYSFERMFVEGLRGDSLWLIKPSAAGLTDGVRVSQALSFALFIGVLAFLVIRTIREKKEGRLMWPKPIAVSEDGENTECACCCDHGEDEKQECECGCCDHGEDEKQECDCDCCDHGEDEKQECDCDCCDHGEKEENKDSEDKE